MLKVQRDVGSYRRGDPLFMTSLARGLSVMHAFADGRTRLTIAQLSRATGLHRAVVRRCLYTLRELGYTIREGNTYGLAPGLIGPGYARAVQPIAVSARPVLEDLSKRLGETSAVAVLDQDKVLYLACANPNGPAAGLLAQDLQSPACCTAAGPVLLASLPEQQPDRELSRIRAAGYALTGQDSEFRVRALAVPVRSSLGKTIAAMEVGVRATGLSREELLHSHLPLLKTAAVALGRGLRNP